MLYISKDQIMTALRLFLVSGQWSMAESRVGYRIDSGGSLELSIGNRWRYSLLFFYRISISNSNFQP